MEVLHQRAHLTPTAALDLKLRHKTDGDAVDYRRRRLGHTNRRPRKLVRAGLSRESK